MSNYLTPKETADYISELSVTKATISVKKRFLLSFMAGVFVALGAHGFLVAYEDIFLRAAVFPVGLMLIILVGGELFTGNCLMTLGLLNKKINVKSYASSITQVFFGNLAGMLFMVMLMYFSGLYKIGGASTEAVIDVATSKISYSFTQIMFKGILCNIIVAAGIWLTYVSKDVTGKLFACWFTITLFALSGYEHCIANMYFLPLASLYDSSITLSGIVSNIVPATIGNFIGGGILVPLVYYHVHYKDQVKSTKTSNSKNSFTKHA